MGIPYKEVKGKIKYYLRTSTYLLILEMNLNDLTETKIDRNVGYAFDIVSNMLKPGEIENMRKRFIQYNFNTVFVDKENKIIYDDYNYLNNENNLLSKKAQITHINIAKMSDMWYDKTYKGQPDISEILFWLGAVIMENEKSKFKELIKNAPIDKVIANKLERKVLNMNSNEELFGRYYNREEENAFWKAVERENVRDEGISIGFNRGMTQGVSQERVSNIINFYKNGVPIEVIGKSLGLRLSEVKSIIKNKSKKNNKYEEV